MRRLLLIAATLAASWLATQAVHEAGHVLAAWATGGQVARVVLHPLEISRTELSANPRPLLVAWAGPLAGVAAPLALWALALHRRWSTAPLMRFFAGFALAANGLYLGLGSLRGMGDAGDLLRHGAPPWQLWLFGAVASAAGLALWHGQGRHFG
ncbi:MAG TPA: M50 family metallopeptidase, partial [Lacipirellulaceae bacterium]|nr:M50 family metallopeptidase [Lacipirellulaceae bacterium]